MNGLTRRCKESDGTQEKLNKVHDQGWQYSKPKPPTTSRPRYFSMVLEVSGWVLLFFLILRWLEQTKTLNPLLLQLSTGCASLVLPLGSGTFQEGDQSAVGRWGYEDGGLPFGPFGTLDESTRLHPYDFEIF